MDLNSVKNAFTLVGENQRLCSLKVQEVINKIGLEIEGAITERKSKQALNLSDDESMFYELHGKLVEMKPVEKLEEVWKQLDDGMQGCEEALEITFVTDISKAYRNNNDYDSKTINQIVADHFYQQTINQIVYGHFYQQGLFGVGDLFAEEAFLDTNDDDMSRDLYKMMHRMIESMRAVDLKPALEWSTSNRAYLREKECSLQVKLHAVQLMEILQTGDIKAALTYVGNCLELLKDFAEDTKKLLANVVLIDQPAQWPYAELLSTSGRAKMEEELKQHFCDFEGLSTKGHLRVSVAAGFGYLPHLLKVADQMAATKQEWMAMKQCPEPFDLKKQFLFHSSYICGQCSREVTPDNPLKLLPCGHAMCNFSLQLMIKFALSKFSCHICGQKTTANKCKDIYLSYHSLPPRKITKVRITF